MAGPIRIAIIGDARRFKSEITGANSTLAKLGRASKLAALGLGSFAGAAAAFTYKVGSDYVDSLNQIQSLTGANAAQMKAAAGVLESQAGQYAKLGQTTGDAASGVVELAKSGLSLDDSLKAVKGTMVLAKAGALEVADASAVTANSLNAFHLKAKQAGDIANYLANAANISSADVADLAESLKYVSPVAASSGVSLKETAAILAELANSGIKGSQAGTTLRTFLLGLQAPAKAGANALHDLNTEVFDANGNMKPLPDLIDQLSRGLERLPDDQAKADLKAIFGKTGIAGATTILEQGTDGLKKYSKGVERAGAANKLAKSRTKGLAGEFASIKAQVTSFAQEVYRKYSPALDQRLRTFIQQMKTGKGAGGEFVGVLKDLRDIAKELWPQIKNVAHWTGEFLGFLASHKKTTEAFVAALLALKGLQVAKGFGLGKVGGGVASKVLGGGIQKVFVVNMGPGGLGGGLGGPGGGGSSLAKSIPIIGSLVAAGIFSKQFADNERNNNIRRFGTNDLVKVAIVKLDRSLRASGGPSLADIQKSMQTVRVGPFEFAFPKVLKSTSTAVEALRQNLGKASQGMELVGHSADRAFPKATKQVIDLSGKVAKIDGSKASAAFDLVGTSAAKNTALAGSKVDILSGKIKSIPDKKVQIDADTSDAMQRIAAMRYEIDQLHGKTVILRATGGHVPGDTGSGSGSGAGSGSSRSASRTTVVNVNVAAPVGADAYTIGEELKGYLDVYLNEVPA